MQKINWDHIKAKLKEAIFVLPHFFKNPVQGMRQLPDWDWPTTLVLQGAFAAACAVLSNLIDRDFIGVILGLIISPIANYLMMAIGTGIFFYAFMFLFKRELPFQKIYIAMLFASIPLQIVAIVSSKLPPILIVGVVASLLLLFVAFVESFGLERLKVRNLLIAVFALYLVGWTAQLIRSTARHERLKIKATPESLDILEQEMKSGG